MKYDLQLTFKHLLCCNRVGHVLVCTKSALETPPSSSQNSFGLKIK